MNINLIDNLLELKDCLTVPLKYVDKSEAHDKDYNFLKVGYIGIKTKEKHGENIVKYATLDTDEFLKYRDENEFAIQVENMKNIRTIKKCILFFTFLTIISLVVGLLWGVYLLFL